MVPLLFIPLSLRFNLKLEFIFVESAIVFGDLLKFILESLCVRSSVVCYFLEGYILGPNFLLLQLPISQVRLEIVYLGPESGDHFIVVFDSTLVVHLIPELLIVQHIITVLWVHIYVHTDVRDSLNVELVLDNLYHFTSIRSFRPSIGI